MKELKVKLLKISAILLTLALALGVVADAAAQAYPAKPVKIVIPYPPGGAGDAVARAIGQRMSNVMKQPVVIENKPGASQAISASAVATAAPDGYTLLMASGTSLVLNPILMKSIPYNPEKDLALVSRWGSAPNFLIVGSTVPANSVQELIALAKAKPGTLNFGSIGNGSNLHIAGEMMNHMAKVNMVHIPYKGTALALTDLLGGQIQLMFDPGTAALQMARDGRVKLLAVTSSKRVAQFPDTPTMMEAGVPGYEIDSWWGLAAPAGTPKAILDQLSGIVAQALADPTLRQAFAKDAITFVSSTPEGFNAFVREERTKWQALIKAMKIQPE
jgi:tripartite-type tricarboxylate transporter receptor subunit TctC